MMAHNRAVGVSRPKVTEDTFYGLQVVWVEKQNYFHLTE